MSFILEVCHGCPTRCLFSLRVAGRVDSPMAANMAKRITDATVSIARYLKVCSWAETVPAGGALVFQDSRT
eukprot:3991927-Pleurochrysis_carterae.AAC.1